MPGDVLLRLRLREEPVARSMRVGHGLLRGEGLGRHDEQRRLRVQRFQRFLHVRAVDVGNEMHLEPRMAVGLECLIDHLRPQIGAADADVDHVGDALAGVTAPLAASHLLGEGAHALDYRIDLGHHVLAVDHHRRIAAVAQCRVQHCTVLGVVDLVAGKHPFAPAGHVRFFGQAQQQLHGLLGDAVLRVVQQKLADLERKPLEPARIGREQIAHVQSRHLGLMRPQALAHRTVQRPGNRRVVHCLHYGHFPLLAFVRRPMPSPQSSQSNACATCFQHRGRFISL